MNYKPVDELTITQMVYNRLPFLEHTENNDTLINSFIWEVMNELEHCFQVGVDNPDHIGDDQYYTVEMESIIADLVTVYILLLVSAQNAQGSSSSSSSSGSGVRFMKKAKAGTAEVEWGELDIKKSGSLNIGGAGLIQKYEESAARKARNMGCIIDICTDCVGLANNPSLPFVVVSDCGCGCN